MSAVSDIQQKISCFHCDEECSGKVIVFDNKNFCCEGCKTVFEILDSNDLCDYYSIENNPGINIQQARQEKHYGYLDDPEVINKLINFKNAELTKVTLVIPKIHCSSCIWLLEQLYKINKNIIASSVNFLKKELSVTFQNEGFSLRSLVELLATLGYDPDIHLQNLERKSISSNKQFYYKLGIAAFCFGNIMLLSFPEYLALDNYIDPSFSRFFGYINLLLSLPAFLYSSSDYFESAWKGLQNRMLNIDVPVSLGISTLFLRSAYDILTYTGAGYLDSMTGLIFFLLIGKWFQNKTYQRLSFERDYKSYFPVSIIKKSNNLEISTPVSKLEIGDIIIVRNNELIPADSVLINGHANIDYSFVTGEAEPVTVKRGNLIYAGGRQNGHALELQVSKKTSQSYLTQLWENEAFKKEEDQGSVAVNQVSQYFTPAILLIAFISGGYWLMIESSLAMNVFTSVLIIACPCALALSTPFTLGNALRILGSNKFFLKNTAVIENISEINEIVFDKTGTITYSFDQRVDYEGTPLSPEDQKMVKTLVGQSSHPLSQRIYKFLESEKKIVNNYQEIFGKGIEGKINDHHVRLGSADFIGINDLGADSTTKTFVSIDDKVKGCFTFSNQYRKGLKNVIEKLHPKHHLSMISGDTDGERKNLVGFFKDDLYFNKHPEAKLQYIKSLQSKGKNVMMIGDGLNDAGALKQSNVGISISENTNNFSPSSDAILDASVFEKLPSFLKFSEHSIQIVRISFLISLLYNAAGLYFAVQGLLTPLIAAILMPLSSISVVVFGTGATSLLAWRLGFLNNDKSHLNN